MRKLLRNMAKAKMAQMGYSWPNKRMRHGQWRQLVGAYPVSLTTGKQMKKGWYGKKKYDPGHVGHLFVY